MIQTLWIRPMRLPKSPKPCQKKPIGMSARCNAAAKQPLYSEMFYGRNRKPCTALLKNRILASGTVRKLNGCGNRSNRGRAIIGDSSCPIWCRRRARVLTHKSAAPQNGVRQLRLAAIQTRRLSSPLLAPCAPIWHICWACHPPVPNVWRFRILAVYMHILWMRRMRDSIMVVPSNCNRCVRYWLNHTKKQLHAGGKTPRATRVNPAD